MSREPSVPPRAAAPDRVVAAGRPPGPRFTTFQLLLIGMFAALVVLGNLALKLPVKLPGHSGVLWMALLTTLRAAVPKPGAAALAGVLSGLLAMLLGVGDKGALNTVLSHAAAGLGVDLVLSALGPQPKWGRRIGCALAGLVGNLGKFTVKILLQLWIGVPVGFLVLGESFAALTHAGFGLLGGVLGSWVIHTLEGAGYFTYLRARR